jgi:hypothetical protein
MKFNGASYPVQKAAAAVYSDEGWAQTKEIIDYYMENARIIREGLKEVGTPLGSGLTFCYSLLHFLHGTQTSHPLSRRCLPRYPAR